MESNKDEPGEAVVEEISFLPLVKAYPALSKRYGEVSCVAGVRMTGPDAPSWIRLYPIPFRALDEGQQFQKYQPIKVRVEAHRGDARPETRRPDRDSIGPSGDLLSTRRDWDARRRFVEPLMVESMCELRSRQERDRTSLGVFRPAEVKDLLIEPADIAREKTEIARAWAAQGSLLQTADRNEQSQQLRQLEQIPWSFKYHYRCTAASCGGHTQSIIDWEIAQLYRSVRRRDDWQDRMRRKWLDQLCAADRDTAFFVGNQHQHPTAFLVLGVWWPPKRPQQPELGDLGDA